MQVYLFCGKLLLTFFIQRLQTFFIFVTFFTFFNVFYFEWNVFIIYGSGHLANHQERPTTQHVKNRLVLK